VHHTASHCSTLQHTAAHCSTLQHTATHCSTHTAAHCNTLQHAATRCSTLQTTAIHCNTLHHTATHCIALQHTRLIHIAQLNAAKIAQLYYSALLCWITLQHTATNCNTLQHTATHCNTLQHTAAHCSTLQHTAAHCNTIDSFTSHRRIRKKLRSYNFRTPLIDVVSPSPKGNFLCIVWRVQDWSDWMQSVRGVLRHVSARP